MTFFFFFFFRQCLTLSCPTALGTGIGLGVVCAGRVVNGARGLIEGGHMVKRLPHFLSALISLDLLTLV